MIPEPAQDGGEPTWDDVTLPASRPPSPFGYSYSTTTVPAALCPDLLSIRNIGEADGWRGHVVRGFLRVLAKVTGV